MSFDPHTIEHLGIKMYSVLPNAIAELVANAYDAEARNVHIKLYDKNGTKKILVIDDGTGMSFEEINDKFLRIGRKRREEDRGKSINGLRNVSGRKGLGKLAFFGIGDTISISTCREGIQTKFILKWNDLINSPTPNYEPYFETAQCNQTDTGTRIELSDLKRKSDFDIEHLAISLSKLFNFFDDNFLVDISLNDAHPIPIDNTLKYQNILPQFIWDIPNAPLCDNYFHTFKISGNIIATEKPLPPGLRGVTLFAHGRLVNAPEFFGVGESSHGYSYITGFLNVDFIDEGADDVISTDRQSLSWDLAITSELRQKLQSLLHAIEKDWREKRKKERRNKLGRKTQFNIDEWFSTLSGQLQKDVDTIISSIIENSELPSESQEKIVNALHSIAPEYAHYHWRHLHTSVKNASYEDYKNEDYYSAVEEAIKRYEATVKTKADSPKDANGNEKKGRDLMFISFGIHGILSAAKKYKKHDQTDFDSDTKQNIEEGQQYLSAGIMAGARNPLAHEEKKELKTSGLFTESDCLDMLSLLSHLFRRLDDAEKIK